MALVIGAFITLGEAEGAARALLEAGHEASAMRALARVGGGRILLADHVPVHAVGEPARLINRSERAGASAVIGGVIGALLGATLVLLLPLVGNDPLLQLRGTLSTRTLLLAAALLGGVVVGSVAAFARRDAGLPHDLAVRYALRLDQGDTVLGVKVRSAGQARSSQEMLALHGAIQAHVTRGTLETIGEPEVAAGLTPSQN